MPSCWGGAACSEKETNLKTQINVSKAEGDSSYKVSITNLSPAFLVCCKD